MKKKVCLQLGLCFLLLTFASALSISAQETSPAHAQADSLYKRLGGYDALAAVADDWLGRLTKDEKLSKFFNGVSTDSQKRIRQLALDQLCAATGGPCVYIGRDMRTVHAGLGITEADWEQSVKLLVATLDKFKVGKTEKDDLLKALTGLKKDIVDKP
ncbi:MAG: group 1 truncated hemoglobin [Pyrinomonadaceae bacterium]|nr:group 1 truncated hemoglobin [Pyrinomonadaceae bacterium]